MNKYFVIFIICILSIGQTLMFAQEPDSIKKEDGMDFNLKGVVIKAQMPLVKSKDGKLIYSIPKILKESTATNAFDIIKEVPSVMGMNDNIELAGARSLKIVLNGKISSMTLEQLTQLLKSMPASRVESVEIMYIAPAKYNFNGSIINVILNNSNVGESNFMGEAGAEYTQYKYPTGKIYTNLMYASKRWNIDFLLNLNGEKGYSGEDMFARHHYKGEIIPIEQSQRRTNKSYGGTTRVDLEYMFSDKSKLSGAYYMNLYKSDIYGEAVTLFGKPMVENISSTIGDDKRGLHNFSMQYERKNGFSLGFDYTYYNGNDKSYYKNSDKEIILTNLYNPSLQRISRLEFYLNNNSKISGWSLDYGFLGAYNGSHNKGEYYYGDKSKDYIDDMKQKEYNANLFLEASKSFGAKFSFKAGIKGEYFYAHNSNSGTLWNKYAVYPTIALNYMPANNHIVQFNVSSDIAYPGYWDLSNRKVPLNAYSYVIGNPELMPYRTYTAQLIYILKSKYMFVGFYNYSPNYFTQMPYQKEDELATVFETVNFNYMQNYGISIITPFKIGNFWDSKLTITGVRIHEKSDKFHSINFNRTGMFAKINMNNTFKIPSVKALTFSLNGGFVTPGGIQGIYDLGYCYPVSVAVKYNFVNEQATFTLSANDIFSASLPNKIIIDMAGQYSRMHKVNETRYIKLSFSYKFGGYKKREYKKVDTSRF